MALVVGLGGVTCGGKTTLARLLQLDQPVTVHVLHQDDYYWPAKQEASQPDDWDVIDAINVERLIGDVLQMIGQRPREATAVHQWTNNHHDNQWHGRLSSSSLQLEPFAARATVVVVEGHMLYHSSELDALFDKRYFVTLPYELCKERRRNRTYEIPDTDDYFDFVCWPRYVESLQAAAARPDITLLDGSQPIEALRDRLHSEIGALLRGTLRIECVP